MRFGDDFDIEEARRRVNSDAEENIEEHIPAADFSRQVCPYNDADRNFPVLSEKSLLDQEDVGCRNREEEKWSDEEGAIEPFDLMRRYGLKNRVRRMRTSMMRTIWTC